MKLGTSVQFTNLKLTGCHTSICFPGATTLVNPTLSRPLNLFFNDRVDWETSLWFNDDINTYHVHRSKHGKNPPHIRVKLHFNRPKRRYEKSLPERFWIERTWDFYTSDFGWTKWGADNSTVESDYRPRAITEIIERSHFFYVPAVRGWDYFQHLIGRLAAAITSQPDKIMSEAGEQASAAIESRSSELLKTIEEVTGLNFSLRLPASLFAMIRSAQFDTEGNIPLTFRGDGVQSLIIMPILQYLSQRKKSDYYFWGIEEPENSLEYARAAELAKRLGDAYSLRSQIFITSHSPVFLAMQDGKTSTYRVTQKDEEYHLTGRIETVTDVTPLSGNQESLIEDLGLVEIVRKFDSEFGQILETLECRIKSQEGELEQAKTPRLIVEGKHDRITLEHAWKRLYFEDMPFEIKAAGDANELTDQIAVWRDLRESRVLALYDHDDAGLQAIKKLDKLRSRGFVRDTSTTYRKYGNGESVLAMTLPCPNGREDNAANVNLPLEFYFSDSVLNRLDKSPDSTVFSRTFRVIDGKSKKETKRALKLLIDGGEVTMANRKIEGPGKTRLVESLHDLCISEFGAFRNLFETIVSHLSPGFLLPNTEQTEDVARIVN